MLMTRSASIDERKNVMDMRRSITRGTLAVPQVAMATPAAVAEASPAPPRHLPK
jgi:hypothetical protein